MKWNETKTFFFGSIAWLFFLLITFIFLFHFIPFIYLLLFMIGNVLFYLVLGCYLFYFPAKKTSSSLYLSKLAHLDPLTEFPNGIFFNEILNKTIGHAARQQTILAILLIDLDNFHRIYQALGQQISDAVLKELAYRFKSILRSGDSIARLDGDQFIILLNDIKHPKFASPIAEKILDVCSKPIKINNQELIVTASIGIAIFPMNGTSLETLQNQADLALFQAKNAGGGIYRYFTKEMTLEAHTHLKIENALRNALINSELVLYFQPIFDAIDGSIVSIEALLRWSHPELGILSPEHFIPHAEEGHLIIQIGEWALYEACRINKSWQDQGYKPVTISVNLSPKQFINQNISSIIQKVLTDTSLNPHFLAIEITEAILMENTKDTVEKLNQLKTLGVKIYIDDFGTGYTSINYLKHFPIDVLKIDQSFIKNITTDQTDQAIIAAIIALGHRLGMKVIAEGVETEEQLRCVTQLSCDFIQGYFLSRPLIESKMLLQLNAN